MKLTVRVTAVLGILAGGLGMAAQPQGGGGQPGEPPSYESLPPNFKLAVRAESIRQQVPVVPDVLIVPDDASYALALATWSRAGRFPILIDDGTWTAREDIARFVRAFKPREVLRWSRATLPGNTTMPKDDEAARRAIMGACVLKSWGGQNKDGQDPSKELIARAKFYEIDSPGVVMMDAMDPSWTAGVALSAAYAQPIIWFTRPESWAKIGPNDTIDAASGKTLEKAIEQECDKLGLEWASLGKGVDSLTICAALPSKATLDDNTVVAVTDYLGRSDPSNKDAPRWAWAGQIWGTESRAAYMAMCSLFLQPSKAWLVDGYTDEAPWGEFDMTRAMEPIKARQIDVQLDEGPRGSVETWRRRTATAMTTGLVMVNSSGNADFFALRDGVARAAEVPILDTPVMVNMVHSFSAAGPADRTTIAGRWLDHGAYAYFGSVDEPFLQAFIPTPVASARLMAPMPFGVAFRPDTGRSWKLHVIGNPLMTMGPQAMRIEARTSMANVTSVQSELEAALKEKRVETALWALVLTSRDADAVKVIAAYLREQLEDITPGMADAAFMAVFRAPTAAPGTPPDPLIRATQMATLYQRMSPEARSQGAVIDALWFACTPVLGSLQDARVIGVLKDVIRPDNPARDAIELSKALMRVQGRDAVIRLYEEQLPKARNEHDTRELTEALSALRR